MPRRTSSLYDAKTRLSSLVREARAGRSTIITVHGVPVAELVPYRAEPVASSLDERIAALRESGGIQPADGASAGTPRIPIVGKARGMLKTFLAERE